MTSLIVNSNPILFQFFGKKLSFSGGVCSQFVAGVSGAFMLFRSDVFKKIKPFDPDIFMYSEETDLCRNRVSRVSKIYYWDGAEIVHFGGGSSSNTKWQDIQAIVSFGLVTYKNNIGKFFIFIGSCILNTFTYLLLFPVYLYKKDRTPQRKLIQYWGLFRHLKKIVQYDRKWGSNPKPLRVNI